MLELLQTYVDAEFLGQLADLAPAVGYGIILAFIFAVIGWTFGLVIRTARVDY